MPSLRAKVVTQAIKHGGLLSGPITAQNLEEKRKVFTSLEKYFPKSCWAKVIPVSTELFRGEWITAPQSQKDRILLYLHGGGFVFNGTKLYRDLIARFAKVTSLTALSIDYSLAPEHPYPAALNEALAAYKWLLKRGYKSEDIVIGGDSAGGGLVLSLLHRIQAAKLPMPVCAFVLSPATDATLQEASFENQDKDFYISLEAMRFFIASYFDSTPTNNPIASPLLGSLKGFPPLLIHVDKSEVMYNDSKRLADKARKAGVTVELYESEGLFHVWHVFARYMPEAKQSIRAIGEFVKRFVI